MAQATAALAWRLREPTAHSQASYEQTSELKARSEVSDVSRGGFHCAGVCRQPLGLLMLLMQG